MGSVQVITTVIKFAVLAFMATVGLFYISSANFTPWNVNGESAIAGIGGGMAIALFSYLGVETIPYGFSALAQLKWRWVDHKAGQTSRFVRDMIVAVLSLVFSILFIWYSRNTGQSLWVYWAPFLLAGGALLLGIPVYASQRHHLTQPEPVPPYPDDGRTPGAMVGAGIFALLGAAGEVAGAAVWLSFLIAGAIAGLQAYSFARLGAR